MYVILVNEDNTLCTTKRERIMQRSKLFDKLWFLVNPDYKGYDMSKCTVSLEYILPVSRRYCNEILVLSSEMYKDHLKYELPFDTELTSEAGEIEVQLTFLYVGLDAEGKSVQRVRKTSPTTINIIPISAWSDIIPDSALTALDQRIIKQDAQFNALNDMYEAMSKEQVNNLAYDKDKKTLQLTAGAKPVGDVVDLNVCSCDEDGMPVVVFSGKDDFEEDPNLTDVVHF